MKWHHCQVSWRCFVFLVKLIYWSKFHVNIITGSGVMKISFYNGLARNPEIEHTPVWVLPNIWRLRRVRNYWKLQNVVWGFYCFWVIKGKAAGAGEGALGVKLPPTSHQRLKTYQKANFLFIWVLYVKLWWFFCRTDGLY